MTARETRLRRRIDTLRDERDEKHAEVFKLREALRSQQAVLYRPCAYCGSPAYGGVCAAHRDLLTIEHEMTRQTTTGPSRPSLEVKATGAETGEA